MTIQETEGEIGMTITDGADYLYRGDLYRATLEELSSGYLACFQRLPIAQEDDEPSLFLDLEGVLLNDTGSAVGDYNELAMRDA